MRTEDMILVSVDDHVIEPRGMFDGLLPAKYQDKAPKLIRRDDGTDYWYYDGNEIPNIGLNAVVGRPPEEYGIEPTSLDEMRVGCYDVHERVRDMDVNGVLGSMCFPSFPQFCGQLFARRRGQGLGARHGARLQRLAHRRVVRRLPRPLHPPRHPRRSGTLTVAAAESAPRGGEGLSRGDVLGEPREARLPVASTPTIGTRSGQACADEGTVVCLHIGSSSPARRDVPRSADRRD